MTKGSYILIIKLPEPQTLKIGRRRLIPFSRGGYAYVGSAMGGLEARLNRHLRENKKPHWHIDYLLQKASVSSIILCETNERLECAIARALNTQFNSIPGFGNSECRCPSHLFFTDKENEMVAVIMVKLDQLAIKPRAIEIQAWGKMTTEEKFTVSGSQLVKKVEKEPY
jgi:Uri superfamily endonuclease